MNWLRRNKHRTEHEYAEERLSAYLDCELAPEEQAAVERHLKVCEDCHWNLDTLRQTVEWTCGCAPVPLPRVFTIPVEAVAPQPARARRPAWSLPLLQGATALVALLFVVVVSGDLLLGSSAPRPTAQMVAVQTSAVMDQTAAGQAVAITQLVQVQPAQTVVVEAAAAELLSEPAAEKALSPAATAVPPSAPEALVTATPMPTVAAEVGGIGGGPTAVSVTMEVMAAVAETPLGVPRVAVTYTTATPSLTQPLTASVTLTASITAELTPVLTLVPTVTAATAVPTEHLLPLPTAAPAVEPTMPALAPVEATASQAEQGAADLAVTEEGYNAAASTEAPAALLSAPESTAIAAAPGARDMEQQQAAVEEPGIVGTLREVVAPWFGLAEIVLGAAFVLLALITAVVMLRWQPR